MDGILLIDKPRGLTSHDVISRLRKILNIKKIGHAGTLDPLATGLLVLLIGAATKLSPYLITGDKEYCGEAIIGVATDTYDAEGRVTEEKAVNTELPVDAALSAFAGLTRQIVPMYSAVKQDGKKLYELARKGIDIERKARDAYIYYLKRTTEVVYGNNIARFGFRTKVSKGTYIRSLVVDIGAKLGYPAHLGALTRTKSGHFSLDEAVTLEDIKNGDLPVLNMLSVFKDYVTIEADDILEKGVLNGRVLSSEALGHMEGTIVIARNNKLLAVYKKNEERYYPERIWN